MKYITNSIAQYRNIYTLLLSNKKDIEFVFDVTLNKIDNIEIGKGDRHFNLIPTTEIRFQDRSIYFKNRVENYRSEEHTSELQSRGQLVCRLLLEKQQ